MSKKRISAFYSFLLFTVGCLIAVLYIKNLLVIDDLTRDIDNMIKQLNHLKTENTALQAEVMNLQSRDRIVGFAKEKLSMIIPSEPTIIIKLESKNKELLDVN